MNKDYKTWTTIVKEDPKLGLYVELPPELLETLGWDENTEVQWSETEVCAETGEHIGLVVERVSDAKQNSGTKDINE